MKTLVIFILAIATASAGTISRPVHPRDLPVVEDTAHGRITNGNAASDGMFPYQAGLTFDQWTCGGSIIDEEYILTAAHCTSGATTVTAYLGSATRNMPRLKVTSQTFLQHKSYNSLTLANDISLIKIEKIAFNKYIDKVALPPIGTTDTYDGQMAVASGYGLVKDGATTISNIMQYAFLTVISNDECRKVYGSLTINSKVICTATPNAVSTCSGDSGGPLVTTVGDKVIIGVTSFVSSKGCEAGYPAGFERVTGHLEWIKENSGVYYEN